MVAAGLVAGLLTGGFPAAYSKTVQEATLVLAMAFSLTEISFRGVSLRTEARGIGVAVLMSYVALGGLVLFFAYLTPEVELRDGWVLIAAVPPAVGVVPITSFLRGNVRGALIADAVLYLLGLATVPALSLAFLGQSVPVQDLVIQTLLLIGLPLIVSRALRRSPRVHEARPTAVSVSFFVLVLAIVGSARDALLSRTDVLGGLSTLVALRTFGLGLAVFAGARVLGLPRQTRVAANIFAGFKNLGLTVVLASTLFGPLATLPAVVSLVFEVAWMAVLPFLFRTPTEGVSEIPE